LLVELVRWRGPHLVGVRCELRGEQRRRIVAAGHRRADERSGRGPDHHIGRMELDPPGVEPGQDPHLPGQAGDPAAAKHQRAGGGGVGHAADDTWQAWRVEQRARLADVDVFMQLAL
jgi:hypothetical protein